MGRLLIGTNFVHEDEPAFSLKEMNEMAPDYRGFRRYQTIKVFRGDAVVEFRKDLGSAKNFTVEEFVIPGGAQDPKTGKIYIEETVGRLMGIADHLREGPYEAPDPGPIPDLIQVYHDQPEHRRKHRKKASTFGFGGILQRS
ncbi:MAG: hypothetical protein Q7O66_16670 [Dehalococcoidia bacterium]|nr:hypothetical protein [Dehalococcoidia bacterium]